MDRLRDARFSDESAVADGSDGSRAGFAGEIGEESLDAERLFAVGARRRFALEAAVAAAAAVGTTGAVATVRGSSADGEGAAF